MRAGKRAARREVQKHIDFTESHSAKNHPTKGLGVLMSAAFIRGKKTRTTTTEVHIFTFSLQRFLLDPPCSAASF